MKIGIDCRMYGSDFTGIGNYIQELVGQLALINTEFKFILYFNEPEYSKFQLPNKNFQKILVNCPIYSLKEQIKFAVILYQTSPNLMHFPHFNAPIFYFKKNIVTIHDLTLNRFATSKIKKFAYNLSIVINVLKAKQIICVSDFSKNHLNKTFKIISKKVQTVHLGCLFKDKQPKLNPDLPKQYIFYAGNWKKHKNIENLVLAFEILKNHYQYKGKLILTGLPSPDNPKPLETIQKSKYKEQIVLAKKLSQQQLAQHYNQCQCYVQPSLAEGFGLPILEAFYYNKPVVCSRAGALPEIAQKAARYFNPLDPQDIALQIHNRLKNTDKNSNMLKLGRSRLKDFSFQTMAKKTYQIYKSCLKS